MGEIDKAVGRRIGEARKAFGISQDELAERVDSSQPAVASWETGRRPVSLENLSLIAGALERPMAWFVGGPAEPTRDEVLSKLEEILKRLDERE